MLENIKLTGLRSTGNHLESFEDLNFLSDYYLPFFTYSTNLSFKSPANSAKPDYKEIEDQVNDIKDHGFKGRIVYDYKTGEIIKFESKEDIINNYQDLEIIEQLEEVDYQDIKIPDIKLKDPADSIYKIYNNELDQDIGKDIINFYKSEIDIKELNKLFKKSLKDIIVNAPGNIKNKPVKKMDDIEFDYRIQIYKKNFALLDGNDKNINSSEQMLKLFDTMKDIKYPSMIEREKLEEFIKNEASNTNYRRDIIVNNIDVVTDYFLTQLVTPKNKPYDGICSFRLKGDEYKNPDEYNKEVVSKEEVLLAKI